MFPMELDDILYPILRWLTTVIEAKIWHYSFFYQFFFPTGAFFNALVDPSFKKSTDNTLRVYDTYDAKYTAK